MASTVAITEREQFLSRLVPELQKQSLSGLEPSKKFKILAFIPVTSSLKNSDNGAVLLWCLVSELQKLSSLVHNLNYKTENPSQRYHATVIII
jgi:hypothetical protein